MAGTALLCGEQAQSLQRPVPLSSTGWTASVHAMTAGALSYETGPQYFKLFPQNRSHSPSISTGEEHLGVTSQSAG